MPPRGQTAKQTTLRNTTTRKKVEVDDLDVGVTVTKDELTPEVLKEEQLRHALKLSEEKSATLLKHWGQGIGHERSLKTLVAKIILGLLAIEVVGGNLALFFIGFKLMELPVWVAETFFVGMYVQIISIVLIVVKNLFPQPKEDHQSELNKMVDKM